METLEKKIEMIKTILDVGQISKLSADANYIQKYYRLNIIPYSLFHNAKDRVHMGLSDGDVYKDDDLLGAARIVSSYITRNKARRVLELATGRGADSLYLAEHFPESDFYGIDLSPSHVSRAQKKASKVRNYHPAGGITTT